ncbi:MAG: hypothetical protein E7647_01485 [Ruminococcaceae bacterium]|nr:hypothetical protein [Oscillospiraceae bacterium]
MKKRIIIPITVVLALILALLTAAVVFINKGYSLSEGYYLQADGKSLIIIDNSPVVMGNCTKNDDLFDGLSDGDKILLLHDGIEESYPGGTGAYYVKKIEDGSISDIPESVISSLTELGWLERKDGSSEKSPSDKDTFFSIPYTAHDYEKGYSSDSTEGKTYLIGDTDELSEYYKESGNEYTIIEPATVYDGDFFKDSVLIIVYNFAHSGSVTRKVSAVEASGVNVNIVIEEYCPVVYTDDCSGWTHFIELSREHAPESIGDITVEIEKLNAFSYSDFLYFIDEKEPGLRFDGFVNTESADAESEEKAAELAKKELHREFTYDTVTTAYDCYEKMWAVSFSTKGYNGGCVTVYLTTDGITKAILAGE